MSRISFRCPKCQGESCGKDAVALWNDEAQAFTDPVAYDQNICTDCGEVGEFDEVELPPMVLKDEPVVHRMLDLSTAHLTEDVAAGMTNLSIALPVSLKQDEYGFFMSTAIDATTHLPDCLRACVDYAKANNCAFILFDRDAEVIANLPSYSW